MFEVRNLFDGVIHKAIDAVQGCPVFFGQGNSFRSQFADIAIFRMGGTNLSPADGLFGNVTGQGKRAGMGDGGQFLAMRARFGVTG
jgi:hypothetical protein